MDKVLTPEEIEEKVKSKGYRLADDWERENLDARDLYEWRDPETGIRYMGGKYLLVKIRQ